MSFLINYYFHAAVNVFHEEQTKMSLFLNMPQPATIPNEKCPLRAPSRTLSIIHNKSRNRQVLGCLVLLLIFHVFKVEKSVFKKCFTQIKMDSPKLTVSHNRHKEISRPYFGEGSMSPRVL